MELIVDERPAFAFTNGRAFDPAKPTILFIHGAGMDHSVWTLQARYFAHHGANALAVDLPGHGRSAGPALRSIEAMADWVAAFNDALTGAPAALVGHSMGALIGLEAAARHQDSIERLALLGAAAAMPVHPALLHAAKTDQPLAADLIGYWGHGPVGHQGGNQAPGVWLTGHARQLLMRAPSGVLHNDLAACAAYAGGMAAAATVRCPALVVSGREDRMTPASRGADLAAAIEGARLAIIEGSGHLPMTEKPNETLDALIQALG